MEILLTRFEKTEDYSIGRLEIPNVFSCYTVEDAERETKIKGKTAIPTGRYEIIVNKSERFKRDMPLLLNVPNFTGIRIHAGNTKEDTEGCILPNFVYAGHGFGLYSKMAEKVLGDLIKKAVKQKEKVFITIK